MFAKIWTDYIAPLLGRPPRFQAAALCYRYGDAGLEVLLITSRTTKRWILPKGWPKPGTDAGGTALEEAWEEAGIKPRGGRPRKIGRYRYDKVLSGGLPAATDVDVYAINVEKLYDDFPEVGQRDRRWFTPQEAAELVDEETLRDLLLTLPADLA
ncbi:NUDIX hydrolase [Pseudooceanicola atlanticus]|uniref:NUDIX hydrolase n=1 Tax=Pseudooceanicola atlanticus TaxID=1461694 RepID=A0A0A0EED7_9RHOB|nr:NUDIX hydrolase [Pseudooceanicola atlanticus]KGM48675.1 NUDIX hydrolase [Pseudooceanicola atlanticus]